MYVISFFPSFWPNTFWRDFRSLNHIYLDVYISFIWDPLQYGTSTLFWLCTFNLDAVKLYSLLSKHETVGCWWYIVHCCSMFKAKKIYNLFVCYTNTVMKHIEPVNGFDGAHAHFFLFFLRNGINLFGVIQSFVSYV